MSKVAIAPDFGGIAEAHLAGGESFYVEFKSAWEVSPEGRRPVRVKAIAAEIGRTLVGFANADGGDLLVGVEDDGSVTGVPFEGTALQYLVQAPRQQVIKGVDLGASVHQLRMSDQLVLMFRVEASPDVVVTAGGECVARTGKQTVPEQPSNIERRREHRRGDLEYELGPVTEASLHDIDWELVEHAARRQRSASPSRVRTRARDRSAASAVEGKQLDLWAHFASRRAPAWSVAAGHLVDLLRYWNLIEQRNGTVVLRRAALLLFAREPLRWHANNRVRLRRVHGDVAGYGRHMRSREHEVAGPIVALLSNGMDLLEGELEREHRQERLFATSHLLPSEAVEECLVNAVTHRTYAITGSAVEILLYPERIEFRSPGRLPDPITVADLRALAGVHRSRNPIIMRVLRELGWTRDAGEGMQRIFGSMRQVELHEPELEEAADTFVVRLSTRSLYDEATQAWLASYGPYGLEPAERKFIVVLRDVGGTDSIDRIARRLGLHYDRAKDALSRLERKHIVWHQRGRRTYHLVSPLSVPHEAAWSRFASHGIPASPDAVVVRSAMETLFGTDDLQTIKAATEEWKQAGILVPAGSGKFKLGPSFLKYAADRRRG
jgi:ATP-dependent DNA helicase RecG